MDVEGTHGYRDTVPARPPVPRQPPPVAPTPSPMPQGPSAQVPTPVPTPAQAQAPAPTSVPTPAQALVTWLRTPRNAEAPGIYAYGHVPQPPEQPDRIPDRRLVGGAVLSLLGAMLAWSLLWDAPLHLIAMIVPQSWWLGGGNEYGAALFSYSMYAVTALALIWVFGRAGHWREVLRRYLIAPLRRPVTAMATAAAEPDPQHDPVAWPQLRAAGQPTLAERLATDARSGHMNDVDYVRLHRAWHSVQADPLRLGAYRDAVLRQGAAACVHPSGARDLPARAAQHDLFTAQVRIGAATSSKRNPYTYCGAAIALDPALLGTSVVAVGPPGSGKTRHLVRPVVESLCLQALAGTAAVIAVGAAGANLGPADAFDVVIAPGDPNSAYDLDLYGGTCDPAEAAAILATAMLDGFEGPDADPRRAATALGQLLGPYRAAHGRFPAVTELRELLDARPAALAALHDALDEAGEHGWARELAARERQSERPGDIGTLLADRIALLDRPAFAGFFDVTGRTRPFALRTLEHPLRVRIDLPERGHAEASRLLARLVLAQFTAAATARTDRSLFACIVLDDAAHTVTTEAVRGLQRLRTAGAGALLTLRTLDEVPQALRSALLGATGCRIALSGVTTWDGKQFAEAWGTTWVEESDVTRAPDLSGGILRRLLRGIKRLFTGETATTESVTVRKVERERWSASDLAHFVPPGHGVLSLTTIDGDHVPPILVDLRG
ncbi:MAG: ATP-binding protein [Streptomycetaceae bacterium]|nr:ATP-binding protein [Streptomycetaceae bacterium]